MKYSFFALLNLIAASVLGNINNIDTDKIPDHHKYASNINFLIENQEYYNHWQPEWTYTVEKDWLIKNLKDCFKVFSALDAKNVEVNLIVGDISHYLYNLQEDKYYDKAVEYYEKAISLAPNDYRCHWFLANHFAFSNNPEKSVEHFLKAKTLLPKMESVDFWEEFTFSAMLANMPSHCLYGMDRTKKLLGEAGNFESQLGEVVQQRLVKMNSDSSYANTDIWSAFGENPLTFISRPLGMKMLIDTTWDLTVYGYDKHQAVFMMVPPAVTNKEDRPITFTFLIMMKVAEEGETLEDYLGKFLGNHGEPKKFEMGKSYPGQLSYEIKDPSMYEEIGGAHLHVIGLKRSRPEFAGMALEEPMSIPAKKSKKGKKDEMYYYRQSDSPDRFEGDIYYAFIFDACEDIYTPAFDMFKELFEERMVIE